MDDTDTTMEEQNRTDFEQRQRRAAEWRSQKEEEAKKQKLVQEVHRFVEHELYI